MTRESIPLLRVIARLNIGGPAIQAISLTALMQGRGYATRLVRGSESADEGTMDDLAQRMGVQPTLVASMRRDPGPGHARGEGRHAGPCRRHARVPPQAARGRAHVPRPLADGVLLLAHGARVHAHR